LDPYCAYLEDVPKNIMRRTFFDHVFDFSMAFDKCKRTLTTFASFLFAFSYLHHVKMHAKVHDKILRALTASELRTRVLTDMEEWLKLLKPPQRHLKEA